LVAVHHFAEVVVLAKCSTTGRCRLASKNALRYIDARYATQRQSSQTSFN